MAIRGNCWNTKEADFGDARRNMRAVAVDEAHLVVGWQVFNICLELLP